jgi:hypothetical protein
MAAQSTARNTKEKLTTAAPDIIKEAVAKKGDARSASTSGLVRRSHSQASRGDSPAKEGLEGQGQRAGRSFQSREEEQRSVIRLMGHRVISKGRGSGGASQSRTPSPRRNVAPARKTGHEVAKAAIVESPTRSKKQMTRDHSQNKEDSRHSGSKKADSSSSKEKEPQETKGSSQSGTSGAKAGEICTGEWKGSLSFKC